MLPVTSGVETTKKNIFAYSILLFPVAVAPYYLEFLGIIYLLFSFPLSAYYILICYKLLKTKDKKSEKSISKQIFAFSILYLFAIFISILVDKFAKKQKVNFCPNKLISYTYNYFFCFS